MRIVPDVHSRPSSPDACHDIEGGVRQDQAEIPSHLIALIQGALGKDVAAIHLRWVRALARANPHLATALIANELRRWTSAIATPATI